MGFTNMSGYLIKTNSGQYYASTFQDQEKAITEVLTISDDTSGSIIKHLTQTMIRNLEMSPNQVKNITWEYVNGCILNS